MIRTAAMALAVTLTATAATGLARPAHASSDDAWAEFAASVEKACLAAAGESFAEPRVIVDPYGSERFGLAIVTGALKAGGTGSQICVYGKEDQKVELGSELGADVLNIAP